MPDTPKFPGVYIEEVPGGVRTVEGVSTSVAAFVDRFARGPVETPVRLRSMVDFEREFGGLEAASAASYGIQQFFLNGGAEAWVVRVRTADSEVAEAMLTGGGKKLARVSAGHRVGRASVADPGAWGNGVRIEVDHATRDPSALFNLVVTEVVQEGGRVQVRRTETFRNLTMVAGAPNNALEVVNAGSKIVQMDREGLAGLSDPAPRPDPSGTTRGVEMAPQMVVLKGGADGGAPGEAELRGSRLAGTGLYALEGADLFNILCIPAAAELADAGEMRAVYAEAEAYCEERRAFLIVDIPAGTDEVTEMQSWLTENAGLRHRNAAVYFPRVRIADPLNRDRPRSFASSGTVAGVYAATDSSRGVWKAPAGTEARLSNVQGLDHVLTDRDIGVLNPLGVNALRSVPVYGNVSWGARTLEGADVQASDWKYIPVRRLALFLEESLYRGTRWVAFEPNDEPLWSQIRLSVSDFMQNLFRQGAFQGQSPREAYFVRCDSGTTTQADIDRGVVNILVGFAPLRPAEFVILRIQQRTGQAKPVQKSLGSSRLIRSASMKRLAD